MKTNKDESICNVNAKKLDNNYIMVNYQQGGNAKTAGFCDWLEFTAWLKKKIEVENNESV